MPWCSHIQWSFSIHERLHDRGGDVRMIKRPERVADVVKQRHHDIFLGFSTAMSASRRLQRVLKAIDGEPAIVAVEQPEMGQYTVAEALREGEEVAADGRPILRRTLVHAAELRARRMLVHPCLSCSGPDCRFRPLLAMAELPAYIGAGDGDR